MPEQEPKNESEPMLSFEEFSARNENGRQRYGNFAEHFLPHGTSAAYQRSEFYKRFAAENPDLEDLLIGRVGSRIGLVRPGFSTGDALKAVDAELYEAYKIMKSYGVSDTELFT